MTIPNQINPNLGGFLWLRLDVGGRGKITPLGKKPTFFVNNSTFTQSNIVGAALEVFKFGLLLLYDKRFLLIKIKM